MKGNFFLFFVLLLAFCFPLSFAQEVQSCTSENGAEYFTGEAAFRQFGFDRLKFSWLHSTEEPLLSEEFAIQPNDCVARADGGSGYYCDAAQFALQLTKDFEFIESEFLPAVFESVPEEIESAVDLGEIDELGKLYRISKQQVSIAAGEGVLFFVGKEGGVLDYGDSGNCSADLSFVSNTMTERIQNSEQSGGLKDAVSALLSRECGEAFNSESVVMVAGSDEFSASLEGISTELNGKRLAGLDSVLDSYDAIASSCSAGGGECAGFLGLFGSAELIVGIRNSPQLWESPELEEFVRQNAVERSGLPSLDGFSPLAPFTANLKRDGFSADFKSDFQKVYGRDLTGFNVNDWEFNFSEDSGVEAGQYLVELNAGIESENNYSLGNISIDSKKFTPLAEVNEHYAENILFQMPFDGALGLHALALNPTREGYGMLYEDRLESGVRTTKIPLDSKGVYHLKHPSGGHRGEAKKLEYLLSEDYAGTRSDVGGKVLGIKEEERVSTHFNEETREQIFSVEFNELVPAALQVSADAPGWLYYSYFDLGNEFSRSEYGSLGEEPLYLNKWRYGTEDQLVETSGWCDGWNSDKWVVQLDLPEPALNPETVVFVPPAVQMQALCFHPSEGGEGSAQIKLYRFDGEQEEQIIQSNEFMRYREDSVLSLWSNVSEFSFEGYVEEIRSGKMCAHLSEDGKEMELKWNSEYFLEQAEAEKPEAGETGACDNSGLEELLYGYTEQEIEADDFALYREKQAEFYGIPNDSEAFYGDYYLEQEMCNLMDYLNVLFPYYAEKMNSTDFRALGTSRLFTVEPELAFAVAWKESRFNPNARSRTGDRGLMQLNGNGAIAQARLLGIEIDNPYNVCQNIQVGTAYLKWLYDNMWWWNGEHLSRQAFEALSAREKMEIVVTAYHEGKTGVQKIPWEQGRTGSVQEALSALRESEIYESYTEEILGFYDGMTAAGYSLPLAERVCQIEPFEGGKGIGEMPSSSPSPEQEQKGLIETVLDFFSGILFGFPVLGQEPAEQGEEKTSACSEFVGCFGNPDFPCCDVSSGICVECTSTCGCGWGEYCTPFTNVCIPEAERMTFSTVAVDNMLVSATKVSEDSYELATASGEKVEVSEEEFQNALEELDELTEISLMAAIPAVGEVQNPSRTVGNIVVLVPEGTLVSQSSEGTYWKSSSMGGMGLVLSTSGAAAVSGGAAALVVLGATGLYLLAVNMGEAMRGRTFYVEIPSIHRSVVLEEQKPITFVFPRAPESGPDIETFPGVTEPEPIIETFPESLIDQDLLGEVIEPIPRDLLPTVYHAEAESSGAEDPISSAGPIQGKYYEKPDSAGSESAGDVPLLDYPWAHVTSLDRLGEIMEKGEIEAERGTKGVYVSYGDVEFDRFGLSTLSETGDTVALYFGPELLHDIFFTSITSVPVAEDEESINLLTDNAKRTELGLPEITTEVRRIETYRVNRTTGEQSIAEEARQAVTDLEEKFRLLRDTERYYQDMAFREDVTEISLREAGIGIATEPRLNIWNPAILEGASMSNVSLDMLVGFGVRNAEQEERLLALLREAGIETVGGRPVEETIVIVDNFHGLPQSRQVLNQYYQAIQIDADTLLLYQEISKEAQRLSLEASIIDYIDTVIRLGLLNETELYSLKGHIARLKRALRGEMEYGSTWTETVSFTSKPGNIGQELSKLEQNIDDGSVLWDYWGAKWNIPQDYSLVGEEFLEEISRRIFIYSDVPRHYRLNVLRPLRERYGDEMEASNYDSIELPAEDDSIWDAIAETERRLDELVADWSSFRASVVSEMQNFLGTQLGAYALAFGDMGECEQKESELAQVEEALDTVNGNIGRLSSRAASLDMELGSLRFTSWMWFFWPERKAEFEEKEETLGQYRAALAYQEELYRYLQERKGELEEELREMDCG